MQCMSSLSSCMLVYQLIKSKLDQIEQLPTFHSQQMGNQRLIVKAAACRAACISPNLLQQKIYKKYINNMKYKKTKYIKQMRNQRLIVKAAATALPASLPIYLNRVERKIQVGPFQTLIRGRFIFLNMISSLGSIDADCSHKLH